MYELSEHSITCPYCGETITVLVDTSETNCNYIEDCQVCCRPIEIATSINEDGELSVDVRHEDQ